MDAVDITIIGSGAASTLTLIEVFQTLLKNPGKAHKLKIAVVEKNQEFWKGIPYGRRSSVNALTITSVYDFTNDTEKPLFFSWLQNNKDAWTSCYRSRGGLTAQRWLDVNLSLIERGEWDKVYVPRYLFGNYMAEKLKKLLKNAEENNLAEIKLINGEAIELKPLAQDGYEMVIEYPEKGFSTIRSRKVVLATGSAPVRKMCEASENHSVYINDFYDPSAGENFELLRNALCESIPLEDRNLLVIGSNASSIELLYLLEGMPRLKESIHKILIMSSSGALPVHISTEQLAKHPIPHLDQVKAAGNYNISTLSEAAQQDIRLALQNGANMDYVATVITNTLTLMEALDDNARKEFFGIHAIKLRDSFRRSGPEYKGISQLLIDTRQVELLKAKFLSADLSEKGYAVTYLDMLTNQEQKYPFHFRAIINCSGSDDLDKCSSRLVSQLVNKNICRMNLSRKGLEVNEKFEAAPNLYIMGPLLGGNVNKLIHFWQLENVSRLTFLAPYLAKELLVPLEN